MEAFIALSGLVLICSYYAYILFNDFSVDIKKLKIKAYKKYGFYEINYRLIAYFIFPLIFIIIVLTIYLL